MAAQAIHSFLNNLNQSRLSTEEREERAEMIRGAEMVKIAAIAVIAVSAILFAIFPSLGALLLLLPITYVSYEVWRIADNYQNLFENVFKEISLRVSGSERLHLNYLTDKAPLARSLAKIFLFND